MIDRIFLRNFKCHADCALDLKRLTLLTGVNAGGKSSFMQGALLVSQALRDDNHGTKIALNGDRVRLGTSGEIFHQRYGKSFASASDSEQLQLGFSADNCSVIWRFRPSKTNSSSVEISEIEISTTKSTKTFGPGRLGRLEDLVPVRVSSAATKAITQSLKKLSYLSAERPGIRELFPSPDSANPIGATWARPVSTRPGG